MTERPDPSIARIDMLEYRLQQVENDMRSWKRGTWGLLVLAIGGLISFVFKLVEK